MLTNKVVKVDLKKKIPYNIYKCEALLRLVEGIVNFSGVM
jgi:hypothetical protein